MNWCLAVIEDCEIALPVQAGLFSIAVDGVFCSAVRSPQKAKSVIQCVCLCTTRSLPFTLYYSSLSLAILCSVFLCSSDCVNLAMVLAAWSSGAHVHSGEGTQEFQHSRYRHRGRSQYKAAPATHCHHPGACKTLRHVSHNYCFCMVWMVFMLTETSSWVGESPNYARHRPSFSKYIQGGKRLQ